MTCAGTRRHSAKSLLHQRAIDAAGEELLNGLI
jgi:hypothetical protein